MLLNLVTLFDCNRNRMLGFSDTYFRFLTLKTYLFFHLRFNREFYNVEFYNLLGEDEDNVGFIISRAAE